MLSLSRLRKGFAARLMIVVAVLASITLSAVAGTAEANHRKGTYGNHGYQWFARWTDFAVADVTSDYCNDREIGVYSRIKSSTANKSYMTARWPSGIRLRRATTNGCDGVVTNYIDIKLNYQSNFSTTHGNYGGENHSTVGSSSWCAIFSAPHPCGYHISLVHLNKSRFTSSSYSNAYRERLIMHETGHSLGLAHHCTSDAIMNDGSSGCNGGKWTAVMSYQTTDRQGIYNTYPGWRYP